jgi:hypothetical protein
LENAVPHPPQHDKSDLGLILLLAIGLPVLLLGGGRALYLVRTEADGNADASGTRLDLGTAPAQTPPAAAHSATTRSNGPGPAGAPGEGRDRRHDHSGGQ